MLKPLEYEHTKQLVWTLLSEAVRESIVNDEGKLDRDALEWVLNDPASVLNRQEVRAALAIVVGAISGCSTYKEISMLAVEARQYRMRKQAEKKNPFDFIV